jgi:Nse4 C-terminal
VLSECEQTVENIFDLSSEVKFAQAALKVDKVQLIAIQLLYPSNQYVYCSVNLYIY